MKTRAWMCVVACLLALPTWAQDEDDELAPLAPIPKAKAKAKPKPKVKPKVQPRPGAEEDDLAPIAPIAATGELRLKLATPLTGAVLAIDGKDVGALPLPPQKVPSGEHTLTVKRPGYAAFVKKVLVPGGKALEVEARLTAVAAVLSVTSDVEGATVLLNGRSIGLAPLTDVEVPAGPAEVAVIKEGYTEAAQKITFVAGKDFPISVKLGRPALASDRPVATDLTPGLADPAALGVSAAEPEAKPLTQRWYFWAGVAAVVVAAAAGTAAGVAASQPPRLTAGDICGPQGCDGCIGLQCTAAAASGIVPLVSH